MNLVGTLSIHIPMNTAWGNKLVRVVREPNLTEEQARDQFSEWKTNNPQYQGSAMWKRTRVVFF